MRGNMNKYIKREDAIFAACKILDKFGGCKMGVFCPDAGCSEVRNIIDTFPMIEIPNQHGKLIDADRLMKLEVLPSDNWVFRAIEKAPTIIPAESEGE